MGWGGHPAVIDCPVKEAHVGDWTNRPNKWSECLLIGLGLVKMYCVFIKMSNFFIYFLK